VAEFYYFRQFSKVNMKLKSLIPMAALAGSLAFSPGQASAGQTNAPVASQGTKGMRNNNPGNIKKTSIKWQGAIGVDGVFVKFASPEDGIRALSRILMVYNTKYKLSTPAEIMGRWAPPTENPTGNYVEFVAKRVGKKINDPINFRDKQELMKLVKAIIEFENGKVPYDDATILRGIDKS
jgi:hypothetical protein